MLAKEYVKHHGARSTAGGQIHCAHEKREKRKRENKSSGGKEGGKQNFLTKIFFGQW